MESDEESYDEDDNDNDNEDGADEENNTNEDEAYEGVPASVAENNDAVAEDNATEAMQGLWAEIDKLNVTLLRKKAKKKKGRESSNKN